MWWLIVAYVVVVVVVAGHTLDAWAVAKWRHDHPSICHLTERSPE